LAAVAILTPCYPHLLREAEGFKEQGNAFYIKKNYSEAFNYYTKAIGLKMSWCLILTETAFSGKVVWYQL